MNLERRLHHAARELREVPIDTPPLGRPSVAAVRRSPVRPLVAPVLFALGGLVMVGGALRTQSTDPAPPVTTSPAAPAVATRVASPTEELEIIAGLVADTTPPPAPAERPAVPPGPLGVV